MARHDQRGNSREFICSACYHHECHRCLDVLRAKVKDLLDDPKPICQCKKKNHISDREREKNK